MAVVYKEYLEIEILRPRRTCTQKEIQQQEKIENSDSESEIETPDNSNDEDFTLERPKKPRKKKKKVPKERREKKVNRVEVPSYQSVMQAQKALEDKLAGRNIINTSNYVYESDDELDEAWTKVYDDDEEDPVPVKQVIEEPPPPEPVKKKKDCNTPMESSMVSDTALSLLIYTVLSYYFAILTNSYRNKVQIYF